MRLLRAELERFRHRGVVRLVTAMVLLASVGYVILAWSNTAPPTAAERAAAQELHDQSAAQLAVTSPRFVTRCLARKEAVEAQGQVFEMSRAPLEQPPVEAYLESPPEFGEVGPSAAHGLGIAAVIAALAMGVSFVAAEFGSGSMGTWLTFVPRRTRVVRTKTTAAALGILPGTLAAFAVATFGIALVFQVRGMSLDDSVAWSEIGRTALVVIPAAVVAAILGAAIAFALRHAAAVAGIVVWWFVAVEVTLPQIFPAVAPATVGLNLRAWLDGSATYIVDECRPNPDLPGTQLCESVTKAVGAGHGAVVVLLFTAVVVAIGAFAFRRRAVA